MAQLNFDARTVAPDAGQQDPVPAGWYNVVMDKSEMKPTKDGSGMRLEMQFKIIDGQFTNRKIFEGLNLQNSNPVAQEIAYKQLSAIAHAVKVLLVEDSSQLHNIPLKIKVNLKAAGGGYDAKNEIKAYKDINEVVTAPAAAPGAPAAFGAAPAAFAPPAIPVPQGAPPAAAWAPPAAAQPWAAPAPVAAPAQAWAPPAATAPVQQAAPAWAPPAAPQAAAPAWAPPAAPQAAAPAAALAPPAWAAAPQAAPQAAPAPVAAPAAPAPGAGIVPPWQTAPAA